MKIFKKTLALKPFFLIILIISDILGTQEQETIPQKPKEDAVVTIFIHGVLLRMPLFTCEFKDKGLVSACNINPRLKYYKMLQELTSADPEEFPECSSYIFGWAGSLSAYQRHITSYKLYEQIQCVMAEYEKKLGYRPRLKIIAHSHGCNVALNLAYVHMNKKDPNFCIDELILIACPVQISTQEELENPIFRRRFALYSTKDFIPFLAPQATYDLHRPERVQKNRVIYQSPMFSSRRFCPTNGFIQAKIKINNQGVKHTGFTNFKFMSHLPKILKLLNREWEDPFLPKLHNGDVYINLKTKKNCR